MDLDDELSVLLLLRYMIKILNRLYTYVRTQKG